MKNLVSLVDIAATIESFMLSEFHLAEQGWKSRAFAGFY